MDVPHFLEGLDTSDRLREQLTDEQWELHWLCCLETTMLVVWQAANIRKDLTCPRWQKWANEWMRNLMETYEKNNPRGINARERRNK